MVNPGSKIIIGKFLMGRKLFLIHYLRNPKNSLLKYITKLVMTCRIILKQWFNFQLSWKGNPIVAKYLKKAVWSISFSQLWLPPWKLVKFFFSFWKWEKFDFAPFTPKLNPWSHFVTRASKQVFHRQLCKIVSIFLGNNIR